MKLSRRFVARTRGAVLTALTNLVGVVGFTGAVAVGFSGRSQDDPPAPAAPQAEVGSAAAVPLAREWAGVYSGTMKIFAGDGRLADQVPMRLEIGAAGPGEAHAFRLTYGDPATAPVRDYRLVPVEGKPNRFLNDEQNGVLLDTFLVADTLFAQFEVSGSRIDSRFRLDGDRLTSEMVTYSIIPERKTELDPGSAIRTFLLQNVQRAVLERQH